MANNQGNDFRLVCPQISKDGKLPRHYTLEGQGAKNISPRLEWYNVPEGTKSLALLVEDVDGGEPDGPQWPWTDWVVFNILLTDIGLKEGFSSGWIRVWDYGEVGEGYNDWKLPGWREPVVEHHGHRLEFKLFALDVDELQSRPRNKVTREKMLEAMKGHVLGEALLKANF